MECLSSSTVSAVNQPTVTPEDVIVAIQDNDVLNGWRYTLPFAQLLPQLKDTTPQGASTKWLYDNHQGYRLIAEHIQGRIDAISSDIQRDLIINLKDALKYPAGNVGRRLDNRWFESDIAFFQLIGVVNRLDKGFLRDLWRNPVSYIDLPIKMIRVRVLDYPLHSMLSWNQRQRTVYL